MLQLHKRLVDDKKVADTTASAYIKTLFLMNEKAPFKTLAFLKKTDAIEAKIATYAESTQKTLYATLASILSLDKDKTGYKKVYQYYYDKMMNKSKDAKEADTSEPSDKQKENWLSWEEVVKTKNDLRKKVVESVGTKKTLTEDEYNDLLALVVLSLYVDIPPRRNQDYLGMLIKPLPKKAITLPTDKNFLVVENKVPTKFIYNVYKTSKTYGQQEANIPPNSEEKPLYDTLLTYFKYHPLKVKSKEVPFLVGYKGEPLKADNAITRILNKVFGKKIGCSMLRHIYLSDKYDVSDMKLDAEAMGHSLSQQREYLKHQPEQSSPPPPTDAQTPPVPPSTPSP
jgi:hypothetical protein